MKQISLLTAFLLWLVCFGDGANILTAQAGQTLIELSSRSSTPGATLILNGKGFGTFKSTQFNRVTVSGVSALVQRWDTDVIEVKVPFKATSGFVEVLIGKKKKLLAGFLTIVTPRIEAITPTEGERGTTLQIAGHHFGLSAGARDPNTMFGVNDVVVGGVVVRPKRWKDDKIELEIPPNAVSGDVVVRLASSDPLPDGSCCAPVEHVVSNAVPLKLIASVRVDPTSGPVGTKVVLFGQGFGHAKEMLDDAVLIGGRPVTIAQWKDDVIVFHVPLDAESGPLVLKHQGRERVLAQFTVHVPRVISMSPASAPIGTLLRINGEHFGFYSESGSTPYNFTDFNTGENRVEIGGVPAVIYRWNDDRIDVWVPFSAKTGKVVIYRSADTPNIGGLCCAERGTQTTEAGDFTLITPVIESYEPQSAGLDDTVTIKGRGFGTFLKTAEHADLGLNQKSYKRRSGLEINESGEQATVVSNVSRTEVLFNGTAAVVQSWTDEEIVVQVPHRNLYGIGRKGEFFDNLATGPLVVRRGSWDLLPDGTCCSPKKWITLEAGPFTIEAKGLPVPDPDFWNLQAPDASTAP
ncbi:MAG TPA: IPT/TIG domain-containing protein [Nitrospira sp.]|nr:IPT/TIG domain-containing protein [Nitrospira sp.]